MWPDVVGIILAIQLYSDYLCTDVYFVFHQPPVRSLSITITELCESPLYHKTRTGIL